MKNKQILKFVDDLVNWNENRRKIWDSTCNTFKNLYTLFLQW